MGLAPAATKGFARRHDSPQAEEPASVRLGSLFFRPVRPLRGDFVCANRAGVAESTAATESLAAATKSDPATGKAAAESFRECARGSCSESGSDPAERSA